MSELSRRNGEIDDEENYSNSKQGRRTTEWLSDSIDGGRRSKPPVYCYELNTFFSRAASISVNTVGNYRQPAAIAAITAGNPPSFRADPMYPLPCRSVFHFRTDRHVRRIFSTPLAMAIARSSKA